MAGPAKTTVPSTQQYINIAEIRNGIIVTKTSQLRTIVWVEPVNFALKSEEDQGVIIGQYQNFINSLNFPIQIVVQSRRLDVAPYLMTLEAKIAEVSNELLRYHAIQYIEFIRSLTDLTNIMDKQFYVVVGFDPPSLNKTGLLGNLLGRKEQHTLTFNSKDWTKFTQELTQRAQLVMSGLSALGLKTTQLDTQKAIELFYNLYNPEEGVAQKLAEVESLEAPIVSSQHEAIKEQIKPLDNQTPAAGSNQPGPATQAVLPTPQAPTQPAAKPAPPAPALPESPAKPPTNKA